MPRVKDLTGRQFFDLTVESRHPQNLHNRAVWVCRCKCGNTRLVVGQDLKKGAIKRCTKCASVYSAAMSSIASTTHGMSDTSLYNCWSHMKQRTLNPKCKSFPRYGGRGIGICEEWKSDFTAFQKWAIENGYSPSLSLDRIDNDKGYYPENCRWADRTTQQNNRTACHYITVNGETRTVSQWAQKLNIRPTSLNARIRRGWTIEDAVLSPRKIKGVDY